MARLGRTFPNRQHQPLPLPYDLMLEGAAPVNIGAPVVSGTTTVGSTLSTTDGTWNGIPAPTFTYTWQRNGSNIGGATSNTYVLVTADNGKSITSTVTASNVAGSAAATSNTVTDTSQDTSFRVIHRRRI